MVCPKLEVPASKERRERYLRLAAARMGGQPRSMNHTAIASNAELNWVKPNHKPAPRCLAADRPTPPLNPFAALAFLNPRPDAPAALSVSRQLCCPPP
jgi:hypothetical protein